MKNSPKTLGDNLIRLEKYMAQKGLASRREAKDLISRGFVQVNSSPVTNPGFGIDPTIDKISIKKDPKNKKEYILLYKPRGVETNKTTFNLKDIHETFPAFKHLAPIGRLDADSEGLIILSNDGTLTKALTTADTHIGKTYKVSVRDTVTEETLRKMSSGVYIDGLRTKPAPTKKISEHTFTIELHEGRKHQIRLMCQYFGWHVTSLTRIKIGHLTIGNMQEGDFKVLTPADIERLKTS